MILIWERNGYCYLKSSRYLNVKVSHLMLPMLRATLSPFLLASFPRSSPPLFAHRLLSSLLTSRLLIHRPCSCRNVLSHPSQLSKPSKNLQRQAEKNEKANANAALRTLQSRKGKQKLRQSSCRGRLRVHDCAVVVVVVVMIVSSHDCPCCVSLCPSGSGHMLCAFREQMKCIRVPT